MSEVKMAPDLRENKMGTMPLGKLLLNMAMPLVLSMLVQALYMLNINLIRFLI